MKIDDSILMIQCVPHIIPKANFFLNKIIWWKYVIGYNLKLI